MFQKILVPFDGSKLAATILPEVVELAKTHRSKVTLMYVSRAMEILDAPALGVAETVDDDAKAAEEFLSAKAKEFTAQGVTTDWVRLEGIPARGIVGFAQKNGYDLIAMATHGRGEVAWVLGSVAEKVVTHATVPVLLFRTRAPG